VGMSARWRRLLPALLAVLVMVVAAACGGSSSSSSSGGGGSSSGDLVIASDFPLQGSDSKQSISMNNAIQLVLDSQGGKAGKFAVKLQQNDDSTAAAGKWDGPTCSANAQKYVGDNSVIGIIGTLNSGCAKLILPVVNAASIAMVSPANTNVGLTKANDPGEPQKYYPTGVRNYARVVAPDDFQGRVLAKFIKDRGYKNVYILNDRETYGQGIAKQTENALKALGVNVLGNDGWDNKQPNYTALFQGIKAKNPDVIVLAGIDSANGAQLIKDKVAVLGDNSTVHLVAPDGFQTNDTAKLKEAEGMETSLTGLPADELTKRGGAAAKFIADYNAKYGASSPIEAYTSYAAAATQALLAAIAASDGTRAGITAQLLKVKIPADTSVLGKEFAFDANGDTTLIDASISVAKGGAWVFETTVSA
jgi:branched-chain amino acid transport system substrate-binding protein